MIPRVFAILAIAFAALTVVAISITANAEPAQRGTGFAFIALCVVGALGCVYLRAVAQEEEL